MKAQQIVSEGESEETPRALADEPSTPPEKPPTPKLQRRPSTISIASGIGSRLVFGSPDTENTEETNLVIEDGPFEHNKTLRESRQNEQQAAMYAMQLDRLSHVRRPTVPDYPAPGVDPPSRILGKPPASMLIQHETELGRMLNSSAGRCFTFLLTVIFFVFSAVLVVTWNSPAYRIANQHLAMLASTVVGIVIFFVGLPQLAHNAGIRTGPGGVDWKPYFVCYRMSYFLAMPALFLLGFGYGSSTTFGQAQGEAGEVSVTELEPGTLKYFEAADGFVALNLTKGVTETLLYTTHGEDPKMRQSRWRNSEIRVNFEPYSDAVDPTVPPGAITIIRIAPIFQYWAPCLTRYRISAACLRQNSIVGWAISGTTTFCNSFRSVACGNLNTELDPVYKCSSNATHGKNTINEVSGLCGRVILPPDEAPIDEFSALLYSDGWPQFALPNTSQVWVDVSPDDCIAHPAECRSQWNAIGAVGGLLAGLVTIGVAVAAVLDCLVDKRIRDAMRFVAQSERARASVMV